jgi:predicted DNA-binding antitoxin AbrB/MazE fold protein
MTTTVKAIYENGKLVLPHPLPLPEKAQVRVTVEIECELSDQELARCYDDRDWAAFENQCAKASD